MRPAIFGMCLLGACCLTAASWILEHLLETETGLRQSLYDTSLPEGDALVQRITPGIDLTSLGDVADLPSADFSIQWDGSWYIPESMDVDLYAAGDDWVTVSIDGELVLERDWTHGRQAPPVTVPLGEGLHRLRVQYAQGIGDYYLELRWAPAGLEAAQIDPRSLFPTNRTSRIRMLTSGSRISRRSRL